MILGLIWVLRILWFGLGAKGIAVREPSVVAMHKKTKQVIAIGGEAKRMLGKTPGSIVIVKLLRGGYIRF